jgi:hypothetical protein
VSGCLQWGGVSAWRLNTGKGAPGSVPDLDCSMASPRTTKESRSVRPPGESQEAWTGGVLPLPRGDPSAGWPPLSHARDGHQVGLDPSSIVPHRLATATPTAQHPSC